MAKFMIDPKVLQYIRREELEALLAEASKLLPKEVLVQVFMGKDTLVTSVDISRPPHGWIAKISVGRLSPEPLHDVAHELGHVDYKMRFGIDPVRELLVTLGLSKPSWKEEVYAWMWAERLFSRVDLPFNQRWALTCLCSYVMTGAFDEIIKHPSERRRAQRSPEFAWFRRIGGGPALFGRRLALGIIRLKEVMQGVSPRL